MFATVSSSLTWGFSPGSNHSPAAKTGIPKSCHSDPERIEWGSPPICLRFCFCLCLAFALAFAGSPIHRSRIAGCPIHRSLIAMCGHSRKARTVLFPFKKSSRPMSDVESRRISSLPLPLLPLPRPQTAVILSAAKNPRFCLCICSCICSCICICFCFCSCICICICICV
jgi:hypothetical protein